MRFGVTLLAASAWETTALLSRSQTTVGSAENALQKVVKLLTDMYKEVEKEKNADAQLSAEFQCWCTKNIKEKETAISEAEDEIKMTTEMIESLTGKKGELEVQIKKLTKDLKDQESDLAATEAQREKEAAEFRTFETDTTKAVRQLTGAITVLKKHQGFLQADQVAEVRKILEGTSRDLPEAFAGSSMSSAISMLQESPYASQSGEVFGILTQMKEEMEADLKDRQGKEAGSVAAFAKLRKSKRESIASTRAALSKAKENLGTTAQELERAKKSIKEISAQLAADKKFLADVEERSAADKKELAARSHMQAEELKAIDETLRILTSDEARSMFRKTAHTSFVQVSSMSSEKMRRARAAEVLRNTHKPQLVLMASKVQLAAFEKVKEAIQQLIKELKEEKAEEIKKRDYCIEAFNTNESATFDATTKDEDLTARKGQLEEDIQGLLGVLKATRESIEQLKTDIATATYNRQQEVAEYKVIFGDNSLVKQILEKALERLKEFYMKDKAFLAQPGIAPTGLNAGGYKKSGSGGGAMGLLQEIIADGDKDAAEALEAEREYQVAYETFMADSKAAMQDLSKKVQTNLKSKAESEGELLQVKEDLKANFATLEDLNEELKGLHTECDFLLSNFEQTQAGLAQEAEALTEAIQILNGAGME